VNEPVKKIVTRWLCPHCRRSRARRQATVEHIARCWHNPSNRACTTCRHYIPDQSEPDVGYTARERCAADPGVDLAAGDWPRTNCPLWAAFGGDE
jgi:hypothetical protein